MVSGMGLPPNPSSSMPWLVARIMPRMSSSLGGGGSRPNCLRPVAAENVFKMTHAGKLPAIRVGFTVREILCRQNRRSALKAVAGVTKTGHHPDVYR